VARLLPLVLLLLLKGHELGSSIILCGCDGARLLLLAGLQAGALLLFLLLLPLRLCMPCCCSLQLRLKLENVAIDLLVIICVFGSECMLACCYSRDVMIKQRQQRTKKEGS
jgi:hypothetical protein